MNGKTLILALVMFMIGWSVMVAGTGMAAQDVGYNVTSELWAKAVLQVPGNPVTLVWSEVGSDTTPSGAKVISGYFYADPNDFAYGSQYNPELFVKIYIDKSGWCNMAFNHVTVDDVAVSSAHNYSGSADQTGTAMLTSRLVEHTYTGVGTGAGEPTYDAGGTWSITVTDLPGSIQSNTQCETDPVDQDVLTLTQSGNSFYFTTEDGDFFSGTVDGSLYRFSGTWVEEDGNFTVTGSFNLHSSTSFSGSGHVRVEDDGFYCEWDQSYSGVKQ